MGCLSSKAVEEKNEGDKNENLNKGTIVKESALIKVNNHSSNVKNSEEENKKKEKNKIAIKMIKLEENNRNEIQNGIKDEETKEPKNKENKNEEIKNEENEKEKEIKKSEENEPPKVILPDNNIQFIPTKFKKLKESIIAENIDDDKDKEKENNIKLNTSQKSDENLILNNLQNNKKE